MTDIRWESYGKRPRQSEEERIAGLGMIRLLAPEYRQAELRRLKERDRRSLIADFRWTAIKLQRRCVVTGKPASSRREQSTAFAAC